MSSQFRAFLDSQTERKFPPNLEEEWRKNTFPAICSSDCPHHQCGYHNEEHYGKPCEMQWEPKESAKMQTTKPPNPNEELLRQVKPSLTQHIEKAVEKAFKPIEDRIKKIEEQANTHTPINRSFNGTRITTRIDIGTNRERIHYD